MPEFNKVLTLLVFFQLKKSLKVFHKQWSSINIFLKKNAKVHWFAETILCAKPCSSPTIQWDFLSLINVVLWSQSSFLILDSLCLVPIAYLYARAEKWHCQRNSCFSSSSPLYILVTRFSGFILSWNYSVVAATHSPYYCSPCSTLFSWVLSVWVRCHWNGNSSATNASSRIG